MISIRLATVLATVTVLVFVSPIAAEAGGPGKVTTDRTGARVQAWKEKQNRGKSNPGSSPESQKTVGSEGSYAEKQKAWQAKVQRVIDYNKAVARAQDECLAAVTTSTTGCAVSNLRTIEGQPVMQGDDGAPAAPAVSPQQAAYIAVARLRLTPPKPMIGPPPTINEWKMAAVGYPMWLWADGNLNPAPVTDSVYDLSVGLNARLVKVVYEMGDGHKVTCTNVARAWSREITPGTPSPACGYVYKKPSLPKGKYTITANAVWAVDWNVNGSVGTIPFYQSAATQLPVGELQVLVR